MTSISIKPGGNILHGTLYLWKEPGNLAANDYFGNLRGQPRPETFSNRFGGSLTGPIYLPKIYHGRDKTFWFFNWEGYRARRGQTNLSSYPIQAQRDGDFSSLG